MKKTELPDGVLIEFGNMVNSSKKFSMMLVSLAYIVVAAVFARELYGYVVHRVINGEDNPFGQKDSVGLSIVLISFLVAVLSFLSLAFWRFLKRADEKESLLITPGGLTLTTTKLGKTSSRFFDVEGIIMVSYADKSGYGHAASGHAASLGQGMTFIANAEGNIIIICDGEVIRFGKDLYSWHAEELSELMRKITHGKLYIQDIPVQLTEDEYNVGA